MSTFDDLVGQVSEDLDSIITYIEDESAKNDPDEFDITEVLDTVYERLVTLREQLGG